MANFGHAQILIGGGEQYKATRVSCKTMMQAIFFKFSVNHKKKKK